jgi:hypothetical protein
MKLRYAGQYRCKCGSTRLRRSSRRSHLENLLRKIVLPWRCETCDTRCFKFSWVRPTGSKQRTAAAHYSAGALDRLAVASNRGSIPTDYD